MTHIRILTFIFGVKLCMFRTVPLSIVRSSSSYTQQWYMSYRFADSLREGSGRSSVLILLASCQLTCMTYTTEKFVHLVDFIIRIFTIFYINSNTIAKTYKIQPPLMDRFYTTTDEFYNIHKHFMHKCYCI